MNHFRWLDAYCKGFIRKPFNLVDYLEQEYNIFYERQLQAAVDKYLLKGKVDSVIAKGTYQLKVPYFCFHEDKKEQQMTL